MEKWRSNYTFEIKCDNNLMNDLVQSYIQVNNFKEEEKIENISIKLVMPW